MAFGVLFFFAIVFLRAANVGDGHGHDDGHGDGDGDGGNVNYGRLVTYGSVPTFAVLALLLCLEAWALLGHHLAAKPSSGTTFSLLLSPALPLAAVAASFAGVSVCAVVAVRRGVLRDPLVAALSLCIYVAFQMGGWVL